MIPIDTIILLIAIGLCTGTFTGIIGSSGMMIVVPVLTILLGFTVHEAIGTSLAVDVIASAIAAYTYYKHKNVELNSGSWLILGAIVGSQLGTRIVKFIPNIGLGNTFSLFLIAGGIFWWKYGIKRSLNKFQKPFIQKYLPKYRNKLSLTVGLLVGVFTGILGVGGGVIFFFTLSLIFAYPIHLAVGTSTFIMTITATSGAVGYGLNGDINLLAAGIIGVGSILGGRLGAKIANLTSEKKLSKLIGAIFIVLGLIMLITLYNHQAFPFL